MNKNKIVVNHPDLEKLIENETRDAKINYDKTKKPYWLGRYGAYYEMMTIYQIYNGKTIEK